MNAILDAVEHNARCRPGASALRSEHGSLGYGELAAQVERSERGLHGRVLGLLLDNGPAWVVLDLAAQAAGMTCVPLPGFFSDAQLVHVIAAAGIDSIVTDQPARLERILGARSAPSFRALNAAGTLVRLYRIAAPGPALQGVSKITFTSGTSGAPKGVCLGGAGLARVAGSLSTATGAALTDRSLSVLPLSTLLENIAVYAALLAGACACVPSLQTLGSGAAALDVAALCRAISVFRPSVVVLVPQMLRALVMAVESGWSPPTCLRFLAVGGAQSGRTLLDRAAALGLPVFEGYGLSEAGSVVSLNVPGACRPGSVGRILPHARLRIAEDGEVLVGGSLFQGYLGKPIDPGGYWPSGDLGRIDADGYLYLNGRKSHVLVTAYGRNISPEWVERALQAHAAVTQAVVFGHARPYLVALLSASPDAGQAELGQAVEEANRGLPEYARVRRFHVLEQPLGQGGGELTPNGRLRRSTIEARYRAQLDLLYQEEMHAVL